MSANINEEAKQMSKVGEITVEFHRKGVATQASSTNHAASNIKAPSGNSRESFQG